MALEQLADLGRQHASLQAQETKLTASAQRLQSKVEAFRTRKETIKSTYTATEAQTKMGEAFSGISEEMADVGLAMHRAEDKTAQLQARAGPAQDPTQSELDRLSAHSDVELEVARLEAALPAGGAPVTISAGQQDSNTARAPQSEPAPDPLQSAENQR